MQFDTAIIGAGAAGMMCAAHAGGRVLVVDHAKAPGEKIRISGGGRCNFTNMHCTPDAFLSANPHFCKSALARYTQWDFIELVETHNIPWHEKTLGQLFCDTTAKDIVAMLRTLMQSAGVELHLQSTASGFAKDNGSFTFDLSTRSGTHKISTHNLIMATGGKSIPKMGATGLAYDVARAFGLRVTDTRAGLVPFTFSEGRFANISGVSTPARVTAGNTSFDEALLFTHRGLSGPAILQASNYWGQGEDIIVNLCLETDIYTSLREQRQVSGKRNITTELAQILPARLVEHLSTELDLSGNLADWSDARLQNLSTALQNWSLTPSGTEGYRTAEVTLGGVDTDDLNARTMGAKNVDNLYFIGEAVDVTGWLGGYNFQWAWSSAMACAGSLSA